MKLDRTAPRRVRITVRVSADERNRIESAAEREGLTLSAYARQLLVHAKPARRTRCPAVIISALVEALARLGKIASALSELTTDSLMPSTERELVRQLVELRPTRDLLMQALGCRKVAR